MINRLKMAFEAQARSSFATTALSTGTVAPSASSWSNQPTGALQPHAQGGTSQTGATPLPAPRGDRFDVMSAATESTCLLFNNQDNADNFSKVNNQMVQWAEDLNSNWCQCFFFESLVDKEKYREWHTTKVHPVLRAWAYFNRSEGQREDFDELEDWTDCFAHTFFWMWMRCVLTHTAEKKPYFVRTKDSRVQQRLRGRRLKLKQDLEAFLKGVCREHKSELTETELNRIRLPDMIRLYMYKAFPGAYEDMKRGRKLWRMLKVDKHGREGEKGFSKLHAAVDCTEANVRNVHHELIDLAKQCAEAFPGTAAENLKKLVLYMNEAKDTARDHANWFRMTHEDAGRRAEYNKIAQLLERVEVTGQVPERSDIVHR
ncbi:unnamed protein product [Amoebophrya sp. A120]|nr:unnamed protein product [Amoebophrya sp. A120]|eukprot:GSA120T00010858001.1